MPVAGYTKLEAKVILYVSRVVSCFYDAEFEILAGLGLAGSTENFCNSAMKYLTFEDVFSRT